MPQPSLRSLRLTLPWPPSVNKIWRVFGRRIILSESARKYHGTAGYAIIAALGHKPNPLIGRLAVYCVLNPPIALAAGGQVWDIANREKSLCDVLTKYRVWLDDSQIDALLLARGTPNATGSVDILINEC